jgi:hypothetical protein
MPENEYNMLDGSKVAATFLANGDLIVTGETTFEMQMMAEQRATVDQRGVAASQVAEHAALVITLKHKMDARHMVIIGHDEVRQLLPSDADAPARSCLPYTAT